MRRGRQLAELIGWTAVAGMGAVMLTQAAGVDGSRTLTSAQTLTPFGIPVVAGVAAGAIWRRSHALALTSASVGIAALVLVAPIVFPPTQPPANADAVGLRAASVNLLYRNPTVELVGDELALRDPDVIVFSEYTVGHERILLEHPLVDRYPYRIGHAQRGAGGMAMWSKFPVEEIERPGTTYARRAIRATLDGPDGHIQVVGVHPPTPIDDHRAWSTDLEVLGDRAADSELPILMIGDFNASYWNPVFRSLLDRGLVDAHIAQGRGWSPSWPTDGFVPPFVRLDHALTGHGLVSTAVDDLVLPGSDHAGVVVTVKPAAD